ncbi:MAG: SurA N-terminal domain-containing protein [Desulfobacterales bacterium]|nr:SurA N-terminal domain-containing protein [Desulfobacterales bacterium]
MQWSKHTIKPIIIFIGCFFMGCIFLYSNGSCEVVERIVAVVNDDIITLLELNTAILPYEQRIREQKLSDEKYSELLFKTREEVLNSLIDQLLTDQEIKRLNITVTDSEIDEHIERIKERNMFTDETLKEVISRQGMTYNEFRNNMRDQILRPKLLNYEVKSKIVVTSDEVKAYYDAHKAEFTGKLKYHLQNITLFVDELGRQHDVYKRMEHIKGMLKQGEDFAEIAKRFSESNNAKDGGDLGWFNAGQLSKELQKALEGLKQGDYTDIVNTDQGYQIVRIEAIEQEKDKTLDMVYSEISEKLYEEQLNGKFQEWIGNLRKQAHIKITQ